MLPIKINIQNFRSISNAEIVFDFTSALIVGQKNGDSRRTNGAGKSSVFQSIAFALYGETADKKSDDIVRRGQLTCEVILLFSHDSRTYRIKRTRVARYSKMTTEFYEILEDGTEVNKTGDTNKLTDANIQSVIRSTYETFTNSSYFQQNSFFEFAQGTFSSRQALMSSLLNIDRWNQYQKLAKERFDEANREIELLKRDLEKTAGSAGELAANNIRLEQLNANRAEAENRLSQNEADILNIKYQIAESGTALEDVNKYNRLKTSLDADTSKIFVLNKSIVDNKSTIKENKTIVDKNDISIGDISKEADALKEKIASVDSKSVRDAISKMEAAILEGKSKNRSLSVQIDNLKNNDICNMCGHEWLDVKAKHTACEEKMAEKVIIDGKLERAMSKLTSTKNELEDLRANELQLEKLLTRKSGLVNSNQANQYKIDNLTRLITEAEQTIAKLELNIKSTEAQIAKVSYAADKQGMDAIKNDLRLIEDDKVRLKSDAEKIMFDIGRCSQMEVALNASIAERTANLIKLTTYNKQATIYGKLTKSFGKDGVQAIMIDNVIEELVRIANGWLLEFCDEPTYVNFTTQKLTTKGDWKETLDIEITTPTGVSKFESLSGGEQFRVSFAIRLALSALQARTVGGETQILLLDEVSTSLDPAGLDMFVSIIRKLERTLKVIVITHDDNLKEAFDKIITVSKTANGSEVLNDD